MHGNLALKHPDQFGQALRHYCRNPRCRMKLKAPVENPHKAFCTPGCYSSFYLKRCLVCEKAKPSGRSDRQFCHKPSCRSQYRRNRALFDFAKPKTGPNTGPAHLALKSPIKSGIKSAGLDDRPWRIVAGPELAPAQLRFAVVGGKEAVEAINRTNLRHWREHNAKAEERCLIKRRDPPISILGGYKFPNAPTVDSNRPSSTEPTQAHNSYLAEMIPDDLSIPKFLKREPES